MTTPRIRSRVSVLAALALTAVLGACASAPVRVAPALTADADSTPVTISFDNEARDYVNVYLIGERREWRLGRVEAGGRTTFRIPDEARADARSMQLAVLLGGRITGRAAGEARATITPVQPVTAFLVQRWAFSTPFLKGQLNVLPARAIR